MSLVASKEINPLEGDAPDINDGGASVTSGAFWPEIRLADVRRDMRLNGLVTTDRLKHSTTESVLNINRQLADWRMGQQTEGYASLDSVPSEAINDTTELVFRYRRAVYCAAKALLTEGYRDVDTTGQGEKHAAALTSQIDTLWRDSNFAVRDILGISRGLAELV
ncbi:head completion/stabilization protein [Pantoea agglomerans]|uniref:Head completion/stabilization protein n=1 Tax=Enterobacter agglomerans TaxID=549 RepID=A0ACC5RRG2_ENTAG|nr:head completion/stabilization protein [Pantoea agglomerans]MBK4727192.1 head completion/stabilization protein [Pantoea agglomerans]